MANVKAHKVVISELTLTLTAEEAQTLLIVCSNISGSPQGSRRKHTCAIREALLQVIARTGDIGDGYNGSIHFEDDK